ncbi:putative AC transposase [Bienertia sinuspersici]
MRAAVWEHFSFTKLNDVKGKYEAKCKYCNNTHYKVNSGYGTSNAKRHIDNWLLIKPFLLKILVMLLTSIKESLCVCLLKQSCIIHIPVPWSSVLSFEHLRLKSILHETLSHLNSRVCFNCDCWSACITRGFLTLTAYFIDSNWSLKSRILNFHYFPPPHRGVDICLFVVGLIKKWSLKRKEFSITCDNVGAMDVMVAKLKSDLLSFGTLPVAGCFFHARCSAHILNLIVQSSMKVIDKSIPSITLWEVKVRLPY